MHRQLKSTAAGVAAALAATLAAAPAQAACVGGQNTVQVINEAMVLVPIPVPVEIHAQWRVADSRSGWFNVPHQTTISRVYPTNYPLFVDTSVNLGVEWKTLPTTDVMAAVNAAIASANQQGLCAGPTPVTLDFLTTVQVVLTGQGAISATPVLSVRIQGSEAQR